MSGNNQKIDLKQLNTNRTQSLIFGNDYKKYQELNNIDVILQSDGDQIKLTEVVRDKTTQLVLDKTLSSIVIHCNQEYEEIHDKNEDQQNKDQKFIIYCYRPNEQLRNSIGDPRNTKRNESYRYINVKVNEKDMDLLMLLEPIICDCKRKWIDNLVLEKQATRDNKVSSPLSSLNQSRNEQWKSAFSEALNKSQMKYRSLQLYEEQCPSNNCQLKIILGCQPYNDIYHVQTYAVEENQSNYQYVEPGQVISINNLEVINNGQMPTPYNQKIRIGIQNSEQIQFNEEDEITINESIYMDTTYTIQKPIRFQIKEFIVPSVDQPLEQLVEVSFYGIVDRVNKQIPNFSPVISTFKVGFPIIMSQVSVVSEIRQGEEAPIAFSITNRSDQPLGIASKNKRLVNIRIAQKNSSQIVEFIPKLQNEKRNKGINNNKKYKQHNNQVLSSQGSANHIGEEEASVILYDEFIDLIQPNETIIISGTLKVVDKNTSFNQRIELLAKLDLGYYHQQQSVLQNIQTQNFSFELTKSYEYNPNSDYLLIYSKAIHKELIQSIKTFIKECGKEVDLWDLSKDGGFSFQSVVSGNRKICELYQGKAIIFLCALTQQIGTSSVDFVQQQSFYQAAKSYSIHTYIIGSGVSNYLLFNPDIDNLQVPKDQEISNEKDIYKFFIEKSDESRKQQSLINDNSYQKSILNYKYSDSINNFTSPNEETIEKKCIQIKSELEKHNCNFYYLYYQSQITQTGKSLLSKQFDLGQIKIVEGLRRDQSQIIVREENIKQKNYLDDNDKYLMFKILSFDKKLHLLQSIQSYHKAKLLIQSIFSDLGNEYYYHQQIIQNNNKYTNYLSHLQLFLNFSFQILQYSKQEEDYQLNNLLIRQKSIIFNKMSDTNKIGEYFINQLFNFRQSLLIQKSSYINKHYLQLIDQIIQEKLQLSNEQIKNKQSSLPQDKTVLSNLLQQILNPIKEYRESSIQYNNQTSLSHIGKQNVHVITNNNEGLLDIQAVYEQLNFIDNQTNTVDQDKRNSAIQKIERMITFIKD